MDNVKEFTFRERQELKRSNVKGPTDKDQSILDQVTEERDRLKKELEDAQAVYQDIQTKINEVTGINEQLTDDNAQLSNKLTEALNELSELKQNKMEAPSGIATDQTSIKEEEVPDKTSKGKKK